MPSCPLSTVIERRPQKAYSPQQATGNLRLFALRDRPSSYEVFFETLSRRAGTGNDQVQWKSGSGLCTSPCAATSRVDAGMISLRKPVCHRSPILVEVPSIRIRQHIRLKKRPPFLSIQGLLVPVFSKPLHQPCSQVLLDRLKCWMADQASRFDLARPSPKQPFLPVCSRIDVFEFLYDHAVHPGITLAQFTSASVARSRAHTPRARTGFCGRDWPPPASGGEWVG